MRLFFDDAGNLAKTIEPVAGRLQTTATNLDTGTTPWFVTQDPTTGDRGAVLLRGRRELSAGTGSEFHGRVVGLGAELA